MLLYVYFQPRIGRSERRMLPRAARRARGTPPRPGGRGAEPPGRRPRAVGATIAGAAGHLSDAVGPAQLADTIRRAAVGDEPITDALAERPEVGRRVLETFRELASQSTQDPSEPMPTGRQRDILTHAAEGMTNQQIARHMGLSTGTVRADVSDLLRRFALRHRTEAVVHAIRRGWISPEASPSVEPQDGTEA
jgi:DNA-binding NarL/FixJ family response regulator